MLMRRLRCMRRDLMRSMVRLVPRLRLLQGRGRHAVLLLALRCGLALMR